MSIVPWWVERHCDSAGVETTEVSDDVFESRRVEQQYAFSRCIELLQLCRQRANSLIEGGVSQTRPNSLAIKEHVVCGLIGLIECAPPEQLHKVVHR